jgi:hypothetical protein
MSYRVEWLRPKKKGYFSKQNAVLLTLEAAFFWESHLKQQGAKDIKIIPI